MGFELAAERAVPAAVHFAAHRREAADRQAGKQAAAGKRAVAGMHFAAGQRAGVVDGSEGRLRWL